MQPPQTCFSPLNNPHDGSTKTYLLLRPYSRSAPSLTGAQRFQQDVLEKFVLLRLSSLEQVSVRPASEQQQQRWTIWTILTLVRVLMASHL